MLQNTPDVPELSLGSEVDISIFDLEHVTSRFDLTFTIMSKYPEGLQVVVEYNTDFYEPGTVERMMVHYKELLYSATSNPYTQISRLTMLSHTEETTLSQEFNATSNEYPRDKSIVDLFEEQAGVSFGLPAFIFAGDELNYNELNSRSNQLAHYLQGKGVTTETLVPICVDRSPEMIIGILGILKAGGAYVPIDPEYPEERIKYSWRYTGSNA